MRAHIGVTIGNAASVAVCHTGTLADDVVFTSPTVLYMSDDGIARLGGGDGVAAGRFVANMTDRAPVTLDDGASYFPEDLVAAAAYCLVETVSELYALTDAPRCTLTCPDSWDDATRTVLADALTASGLQNSTLVSDSDALRTWWERSHGGPAAVVDVGIAGTRVSLMGTDAVGDASFAVAYPSGDTFTHALVAHIAAIVADQGHDVDGKDPAAMVGLVEACETAKIELSTAESTTVPVRLPGTRADVPISRATFEGLISREAHTVSGLVDDCLLAHGLTRTDIESIVLVGGSATLAPLRRAFDHVDLPVVVDEHASARGAAVTHTDLDDGDDTPTEVFAVVAPPVVTPVVAAKSITKRRRPSRRLTILAAVTMTFLAVGAAGAAAGFSPRTIERNPTDEGYLPPVRITSAPPSTTVQSSTVPPVTTPSTTEPEETLDPTTYVAPTVVRFTTSPIVVAPQLPQPATTTVAEPTTTETTTTAVTTTETTTTTTTPPPTTTTATTTKSIESAP